MSAFVDHGIGACYHSAIMMTGVRGACPLSLLTLESQLFF